MFRRMVLLISVVSLAVLTASCEAEVESKVPNLIDSDSTSSSEHTLV